MRVPPSQSVTSVVTAPSAASGSLWPSGWVTRVILVPKQKISTFASARRRACAKNSRARA